MNSDASPKRELEDEILEDKTQLPLRCGIRYSIVLKSAAKDFQLYPTINDPTMLVTDLASRALRGKKRHKAPVKCTEIEAVVFGMDGSEGCEIRPPGEQNGYYIVLRVFDQTFTKIVAHHAELNAAIEGCLAKSNEDPA